MDNERVRNYFGKRNDFNAFQNNSVATPQPIISGDGANAFPVATPNKDKKKFLFLGIGGALVLIIFFVVALIVSQSSVRSDGGVTDGEILEFMNNSYTKIVSIQSTLVKGKRGDLRAHNFFSEETKNNIRNNFLGEIQSFRETLERYNSALISDDYARENFIALEEAIDNDMASYNKLVNMYELFYDYVNSNYSSPFAEKIRGFDDGLAVEALLNLDENVLETGSYEGGGIVQDLFSASLGEKYPEIYYYELMGNIMGGLSNENQNN